MATPTHADATLEERNRERALAAPPARRSAWSWRQRAGRVLWITVARIVWRLVPRSRSGLVRLFGGTVGRHCIFAASARIAVPANLTVGDGVEIGERAILYSLGPITLGAGVIVDCAAHLCAGTHDHRHPSFPLQTPPIEIGAGSFVGIDAYIGPGVNLGARCRVWPRASVYRSFGDDLELRGNPAEPVS